MSSSFFRKAFLFGTLALAPVAARADDTTDSATKATDEAKDTANQAATDTKDQAGKAADATKDTADKATQETKDQAGKAADKASQGTKETGDKAKSMYDEATH